MVEYGASTRKGTEMTAYLILDADVWDTERFDAYRRGAARLVEKHGRRDLVCGDELHAARRRQSTEHRTGGLMMSLGATASSSTASPDLGPPATATATAMPMERTGMQTA